MVERIVLKKVKNSAELTLDMVSTPEYVLKSVNWGTIQASHRSYKYVNQIGITISGTSLETRPVEIEGWIVAVNSTQMDILKRNLNSFVNPQEAIDLFYNGYVIRFLPDETIKYAAEESENNDAFCKFSISGTCPDPLFSNEVENVSIFAATIPKFCFPLTISSLTQEKGVIMGSRTNSLIVNVLNKGSVPTGMRVVFKADGTVVNPRLININTQEQFEINKTLVANEEVVINTNVGEKSVKGKIGEAAYENYYAYKLIDSSWLQLEVGDNLFRYDADSGVDNLEILVYHYDKFLEVQECR